MRRDIRGEYIERAVDDEGRIHVDTEYDAYNQISAYERVLLPSLVPLREKFRTGYYEMILGEDASGRLPTLVIGDLVKKIATDVHARIPEVKFFAGFRNFDESKVTALAGQLEKWLKDKPSRNVLYSSESIAQGGSLANFLQAAHRVNARVDAVIAEDASNIVDFKQKLEELAGINVVKSSLDYLGVGNPPRWSDPIILHDNRLSAVTKDPRWVKPELEGAKKPRNPVFSVPYKHNESKALEVTRSVTKMVADNLYREIGPSLLELFETINIPYEQLRLMSKDERMKLDEWMCLLLVRCAGDPRIDRENSEGAKIRYDFSDNLRLWVRSVEENEKLKYDVASKYDNCLSGLKSFLTELDQRPYK